MTTTSINAIETTYAGCRFRSRLEARWAVFFDALDLAWEYEPQGYVVGPEKLPYLPDFWLSDIKVWIEVKGQASLRDVEVLTNAALAPEHGGLPQNTAGDDDVNLVVLSDIPQVTGPIPVHMGLGPSPRGAHLVAFAASTARACLITWRHPFTPKNCPPEALTRSMSIDLGVGWRKAGEAYIAARSARFEHGERG